jgi:hypothetical protein
MRDVITYRSGLLDAPITQERSMPFPLGHHVKGFKNIVTDVDLTLYHGTKDTMPSNIQTDSSLFVHGLLHCSADKAFHWNCKERMCIIVPKNTIVLKKEGIDTRLEYILYAGKYKFIGSKPDKELGYRIVEKMKANITTSEIVLINPTKVPNNRGTHNVLRRTQHSQESSMWNNRVLRVRVFRPFVHPCF